MNSEEIKTKSIEMLSQETTIDSDNTNNEYSYDEIKHLEKMHKKTQEEIVADIYEEIGPKNTIDSNVINNKYSADELRKIKENSGRTNVEEVLVNELNHIIDYRINYIDLSSFNAKMKKINTIYTMVNDTEKNTHLMTLFNQLIQ